MRRKQIGLSKRQAQILDFIIEETEAKGYPPSVREIGDAIGLQSSSTVHSHLTQLEEKGYIRRDPTKPRAIMILKGNDIDGPVPAPKVAKTPQQDVVFDTDLPFEEMIQVPVIGTVAAGTPILAEQNIENVMTFPVSLVPDNNTFMLRVRGESMINVGIYDDDLIIVTPSKTATNGDIVVAMIDGEATVKTFYKEPGRIRLQPENDTMDPIYATNVELAGIVTGLFRKMH